MFFQVDVNLVGVLAAAVASMVIGMLWYGPLFGKKWAELMNLKMSDMQGKKGDMPKMYVVAFIVSLVTAYFMAVFIGISQATSLVGGVTVGFMAWLGFVATVTLGSVLWEGKSVNLYILNNAYHLVNLIVMGAVIASI